MPAVLAFEVVVCTTAEAVFEGAGSCASPASQFVNAVVGLRFESSGAPRSARLSTRNPCTSSPRSHSWRRVVGMRVQPVEDDRLQCDTGVELQHDTVPWFRLSHGLAATAASDLGQDYAGWTGFMPVKTQYTIRRRSCLRTDSCWIPAIRGASQRAR